MITFTTKMVPTKFVKIRDKEINGRDVYSVLEIFAGEDDNTEINNYDIPDITAADLLVEEGILKKDVGSRMAILYSKTDKFNEFYDNYFKEYYNE